MLADEARAAARSLDLRGEKPPLFGAPIAVKDNYYTAGVRTTANSYIFEDFVPTFDATGVARLKAAGAIIIGKTQMGPLATTRATTPDGVVTTVNAWTPNTPSVNPGGSSTGSATAVAGRMAASSVGTQTGGSITGPSTALGLTGVKPTMGRTSIYGIIPLSYTREDAQAHDGGGGGDERVARLARGERSPRIRSHTVRVRGEHGGLRAVRVTHRSRVHFDRSRTILRRAQRMPWPRSPPATSRGWPSFGAVCDNRPRIGARAVGLRADDPAGGT